MKIKMFSNVNVRMLEKDVNEFVQHKKIVDIKMCPGPSESEAMNVLVMYEE
ncbi:MAG: hypothetical protein Q7R76_01975 [Candidatus Woesearchaeota archaeon]|nr:hypothetical protein [Candidatus Woesearchaeota archaeon]